MAKTRKRQAKEAPGPISSLSPGVRDLLSIGLLYVITLALFNGVVFQDGVFSAGGDTANHLSYKHAGKQIEETEGVDPIWTPYVFSGMPTFGNVSYIPHNVSYVEQVALTIIRVLFLHMTMSWLVAFYFLGGVFMFFLMRAWKFSRPAALVAALTFMLSPYAMALAEVGHGSKLKALSYLPLLILLTHTLFERRSFLSFGLLCAGIGTLMLTNHVQIVYYVFITMGLYLLYHVASDWKENKGIGLRKVFLFTGALVIGLAISAYIYLSVYEYSQFSIRGGGTAGSTGGLTWAYATNWSMHPLELITLLIPSFFGLVSPYYWGWMPFTSSTMYAGIIPIILAIAAIAYKRETRVYFFLFLTCVVVLISFGRHFGLLYELLFNYLPFFDKFRAPSTILHLLPFSLGILGAYGFTAIEEISRDAKRSAGLKQVLTIVLICIAASLLIGLALKSSIYEAFSDTMLVKEGEVEQYQQQYGAGAPQVIDQLKQIRFFGNEQIAGLWGDYVRFSLFALLAIGATLLLLRKTIRPGQYAASILALIIIDLTLMDTRFINPVPSRSLEDNFRPDPTVSFLLEQPGLFRVFPLGGQHYGDNAYAYHGVSSMGGYSAAKLKIYQTVVDSCLYRPVEAGLPVNMNIVNMLNAKFIVSSFPLPPQRFPLVHADESRRKFVFENRDVLPRAFFVDSVVVGPSDDGILRMMNSPSFDPARTAILHSAPDVLPGRPDSTHAEVMKYESRKITVQAFTSSPGLLVLSEIYYPAGWNAYIDGEPAGILRTNYIIRSIVVPSGEHEIELRFEPASYEAGWAITHTAWSLTALCIIVGLLSLPGVRQGIGLKPKTQPHNDERT